jgi:hypothetical protein
MYNKFYHQHLNIRKKLMLTPFEESRAFFKTFKEGNMIDFDLIGFNAISLPCTSR